MQTTQRETVDDIPLIYLRPDGKDRGKLVIWLTGFSGDKTSCQTQLTALTALGYTALSFDPWQHGERMIADVDELREQEVPLLFGQFDQLDHSVVITAVRAGRRLARVVVLLDELGNV